MPHDQPAREVDKRKPPLESRWTRNRRLLEQPPAPPPPPADYVVTGDGDPDPNGTYFEAGEDPPGHPYYERHTGGMFLYYLGAGPVYAIAEELGETVNLWVSFATITGTYAPQGTCTGNPLVSEP